MFINIFTFKKYIPSPLNCMIIAIVLLCFIITGLFVSAKHQVKALTAQVATLKAAANTDKVTITANTKVIAEQQTVIHDNIKVMQDMQVQMAALNNKYVSTLEMIVKHSLLKPPQCVGHKVKHKHYTHKQTRYRH